MMATEPRDLLDAAFAQHRRGYSLPATLYTSQAAYERDIARIFRTQWLFACPEAEIALPGAFTTLPVGRDSIVVLRDEEGELAAFHNTCRHRGSRICLTERGQTTHLVCPYHQWTYALDGRLIHADQMPEGFRRSDHGLIGVHVQAVAGLVFVCLAETPPDLTRFADAIAPHLDPHAPARTKVAHRSRIVEQANWKLVIENNRECYHCSGSHPELLASLIEVPLPDDEAGTARFQALLAEKQALWRTAGIGGAPVARDPEFRCLRLPFDHDALSMTMDGQPACRMLLGDLTEPDLGSVRMFHAPNLWSHFLADHSLTTRAMPLGPDRTEVVTTWLVHEDAVEGEDYDLRHLTDVWLATNDQDRVLAENNHLGVASTAYRPGPYARTEYLVSDFVDWYVAEAGFVRQPEEAPA